MVPILTLVFVIAFSMFITKTATIALMQTGMSRERARFQARSALSGAGFTTTESELVVKHPVRRKIIMMLILLGNAGVVTAISSLILGFLNPESGFAQMRNIYLLIFGIAFLYFATKWNWLDRFLERIITWFLNHYSEIRPKSISRLLTLMDDYEITELHVQENAWLKDKTLSDLNLTDEGLLVLGILRNDEEYIGVPRGRYKVKDSDRLFLYGKADRVRDLARRKDRLQGKIEHEKKAVAHEEELKAQDEAVEDRNSSS